MNLLHSSAHGHISRLSKKCDFLAKNIQNVPLFENIFTKIRFIKASVLLQKVTERFAKLT